ncbi:MAG TPA: cytochrome c [Candidatus Binatia bacterium]|jgi:mono/diheme cytochrome c family protein|nr:cytochrome c [Candidatus Binatia bacterium]
MRTIFGALLILFILVVLATLFLFSGLYNVAAVQPHSAVANWLLATIRDQSIAKHSQTIRPPSLSDPQLMQAGFREYHAMCFTCHSAPGHELTEIGQGLNPPPPKLDADEIQAYSDAELYWIVKNGVRMTGMPAFGPTHEEKELWSIVAFVRRLSKLRPEEYNAMVETAGLGAGGEPAHHHEHGHGPAEGAEGPHAHEHELGTETEEGTHHHTHEHGHGPGEAEGTQR